MAVWELLLLATFGGLTSGLFVKLGDMLLNDFRHERRRLQAELAEAREHAERLKAYAYQLKQELLKTLREEKPTVPEAREQKSTVPEEERETPRFGVKRLPPE